MKVPENGPAIAARIRSRVAELGITFRELSRRAELSETTAQKTCDRLDNAR